MREEAYVPEIIPESDRKMLEKYGGGHSVGFGRKMAVLVVDMHYAFIDDQYRSACSRTGKPAVQAIKRLLDKARDLEIPIFYTRAFPSHQKVERGRWSDKIKPNPLARPARASEIVDEIAPQERDVVVMKSKPSAFFGTQLESMLNHLNVDTLIVTGTVTSGCVRATVVDAFSYNYRIIIPIECVADRAEISHQVSLFEMDMKYADVIPLSRVLKHLERLDKAKK